VLGGRFFGGFLEELEVSGDSDRDMVGLVFGGFLEELEVSGVAGPDVEEVGLFFGGFLLEGLSERSSDLVVVGLVELIVLVVDLVVVVGRHFLPPDVNCPLEGRPEDGREEERLQLEELDPLPRPKLLADSIN